MSRSPATVRKHLLPGDWAVLALLSERRAHGFALAQVLAEDGEVGQVWTMPRAGVPGDRGSAGRRTDRGGRDGTVGPRAHADAAGDDTGGRRGRRAVAGAAGGARAGRTVRAAAQARATQRTGRDLRPLAAAQRGVLEQHVDRLGAQLESADGTRALVLRFRLAQTLAARDFVRDLLA